MEGGEKITSKHFHTQLLNNSATSFQLRMKTFPYFVHYCFIGTVREPLLRKLEWSHTKVDLSKQIKTTLQRTEGLTLEGN